MFNKKKNLINSISQYDEYCDGYGNSTSMARGYILGTILSVAKVKVKFSHSGSDVLDSINAFDKAEVAGTYIGQINMSNVSSFCGPQGLILGYDILAPQKLEKFILPDFFEKNTKVYSIEPLLNATNKLIGNLDKKNFPFLPGSHVPCAGRNIEKKGPHELYCAMAIGVSSDRDKYANLVMEDVGYISEDGKNKTKNIIFNMIRSIKEVGKNHKISYDKIFVGYKTILVKADEYGCALVRAPYILLAKNALIDLDRMVICSLDYWCKYKNIGRYNN